MIPNLLQLPQTLGLYFTLKNLQYLAWPIKIFGRKIMTYSFVKPLISSNVVTIFSFYYDIFYLFSFMGEWTIHQGLLDRIRSKAGAPAGQDDPTVKSMRNLTRGANIYWPPPPAFPSPLQGYPLFPIAKTCLSYSPGIHTHAMNISYYSVLVYTTL